MLRNLYLEEVVYARHGCEVRRALEGTDDFPANDGAASLEIPAI
jgi:hypothetical protein